jgi:hypothetical protein
MQRAASILLALSHGTDRQQDAGGTFNSND